MATVPVGLADALQDRYRLDRELGQGGMATVYLAQDLHNNRPVALKVLRTELAAILGAERFLKEIETTANLQHPHILPLFDSGKAGSFLFYVMPYVEGESLRDRLTREKQLPIADAVRIASEVASALGYAHRHGVLHRDIKPENILLHDGQAVVADFGIALAMRNAGGARLTETGLSLGTPQYMSPEQATAERELDARTDIYALGAVAYEMLTGEPPFTGPTTQSVIAKLMTETPRPVWVLRKAVPEAVEMAVMTALEKLPADRFASAAEFTAALTNPSATRAHRTTALPAAEPSGRWRAIALGAATVAAAAGALAAWAWLRPAPSRPVIRYRLGVPAEQALGPNAGVGVALSPDGARMVYAGTGEKANHLWIRDRDRLDATPLAGTAEASSPFFSPDGRQIGFFQGASFELKVMPVTGGPPVTLEVSAGGGGAWSTDGWIYFDSPSGFKRIPAGGGAAELAVPLDSADGELGLCCPDVLPDGKGLLFRSRRNLNPQDFDLVALDLRTGRRHPLGKGILARYLAPGYLLMVRPDGALLAAGFDRERLVLTGPAMPILEGIGTKELGYVDLAVSSQGTLAYAVGTAGASVSVEVVWVGRDRSVQGLKPPLRLTPGRGNYGLALSPDGTRLALDVANGKSTDIWIKQLPAGPFSRLTFEGATNMRPSWASDGRSVLFISDRLAARPPAPWLQGADGSTPAERLTTGTTREIRGAVLSRDGEWLVYHEFGDSWDIRAIHPSRDTNAIPLLTSKFNELAPSLSPDGKWLAYMSDESGRSEVYVRPFPRVGDGRWQVSTEGGAAPRWAHSGRELYYQADRTNAMMAVAVTLAPGFKAGTPHKLFDAISQLYPSFNMPYYDVTPDDRRFIMARVISTDQKPGAAQLVVVENFREEVRRKLSAARP